MTMPTSKMDARLARIASYLELLIFDAGIPIRQLEVRLKVSHGTINRLLSGKVELKFRHVLEILDVLGIADEVFFKGLGAAAQEERPRATEIRRRAQKTLLPAPAQDTAGVTRNEVLEMIHSYFESLAQGENSQAETPSETPSTRRRRRTPRRTKKPSPPL